MSDFLIPAQTTCFEQTIKKSRFIAFISHAVSAEQAHRLVADYRREYPDARHVCWAFVAGEPGNTTAVSCSDDGEPAGTAGKPMLNVLQHSDVGEILAVVVRYFGGVKLGTGGLVRAYSGSVTEALKMTPTRLQVTMLDFNLEVPYALEDSVRRHLEAAQAVIQEAQYGEVLRLRCQCPLTAAAALQQALADAGRGQLKWIENQ